MIAQFAVPVAFGLGALFLGLIAANFFAASHGRFQTQLEAEAQGRDPSAQVVRALGAAFAGLAAPFPSLAQRLEQQLTYAGRPYGGVSGGHYLAAAIVLALLIGGAVGLFFGVNAAVTEGAGLATGLRWWLFGGAFIGLFLILDVGSAAKRNSEAIEREFPFFLDLAVLVVQAGGTPRKALGKYVEAAPGTPLAREIAITAKDADATSFDDALHRMIDRVEALSVKTILKNLAQGERSSGEAEQFYTDQAEELRYLREEMAARTAERLKTNIVMPVFLMLMAIIIAALAPTIVSIRGQGFF
ncbi:MAG: type II secretion system F family protein [Pseudomonadota bacterium]